MKKIALFGKTLLTVILLAVLLFAALLRIGGFDEGSLHASALDYDTTKWKTTDDESFSADDSGNITVGEHGVYYSENLGDKAKLDKNGVLTVTVEFSAQGIPLPTNAAHCLWFISPKAGTWMEMTGGEVFMPNGSNSLTLGARMYFQNDDQVNNGRVLFRCCDYTNYRTADRFYGFNKDNTGKHEISWTISQDGVTMYVDGNALRSDSSNGNQPTYWPEKAAGTRWTLSDFLDEEGNPHVYFGMQNSSFAETVTIHSLGNGVDYVLAGDYEGEKGALSLEEDGTYLTDGEAHTVKQYDLNKTLSGSFEIKEVPAYVYDGTDSVEQVAINKTAFSVDIKDSLEGGYGFRINWKPLKSSGVDRTEIEFGYLTKSGFTSYSTRIVPSIAVEKHTFAFLAGDGYIKMIADGISEYLSFGLSNALWDLSENIDMSAMYVQYSADDKYSSEYTGKWRVRLGNIVESETADWLVSNSETVRITGEQQAGAVEYDYRMYPTIAENQTITVNGTAQDVAAFGCTPIKLYSKIALNLEMTLNVSSIPAYQTENEDAFIVLSFSNVVGGETDLETTAKAFLVRLGWKDADTLAAYCKMDVETKEYTVNVSSGEIKVEFGWIDSVSVIRINGETVLTGSITKGHFGSVNGVQGYFAMRAYNGASDENAKWAFTLSAPKHIEAVADETPTPPTDGGNGSSGETETSGCGSVCVGTGITCLLLGIGAALALKKKED